jgi:hypothetical protein
MIKFFRKIRQNLLMENKTGKYFKYAIGEIILVVIGILIALGINNWNIKNVQQKEVRTYLTSIKSNLIQDTLSLSVRTQDIKQNIQTFDSIISLINTDESTLLLDSQLTLALFNTHRFITEKNSFEDLTSNGKFSIIENKEIKEDILSYYNFIENSSLPFNNSLETYTRETLAPYFMRNYQLEFPIDFNINLNESTNFVSEDKNVIFEMNAIKYRYFVLSQLIEIYATVTKNAKKTIDLIDSELKK